MSVQVEPSLITDGQGIYIAVNDHYQLGEPSDLTTTGDLIETLTTVWDDTKQRADDITERILAVG